MRPYKVITFTGAPVGAPLAAPFLPGQGKRLYNGRFAINHLINTIAHRVSGKFENETI
jgi:hypothetical protein